jgi:hypothetical protein
LPSGSEGEAPLPLHRELIIACVGKAWISRINPLERSEVESVMSEVQNRLARDKSANCYLILIFNVAFFQGIRELVEMICSYFHKHIKNEPASPAELLMFYMA